MTPRLDPQGRTGSGPLSADTSRRNLLLLVQLRWIALSGQVVTIAIAQLGFGIRLPLAEMGAVLAAFLGGNLLTLLRARRGARITHPELFLSLTLDAMVLTALLYLSGGATNPFTALFLLQVILGAVLLEAWAVWAMVGVTALCLVGLSFVYRPLTLPTEGPELFALYIRGVLVAFGLNAVLLVIFIGRINANLRRHDRQLAALREQAAEEDHIVRIGLLASGAAHELGTPLATIDVILGDWRRSPKIAADPELASEVEEMRAEVARCKTIVAGVLVSAGEARPETAEISRLKAYLSDVFNDWKRRRAADAASFDDALSDDPAIAADSALRQAIQNLLDNALEASPAAIQLSASMERGHLIVRARDAGPGFPTQVLADLGKPYNSTKGRPGGGLGLFLAANVARKLGGHVKARNLETGGAEVSLAVPLAALAMETPT